MEEGQREVRGLAAHEQLRPTTSSSEEEELDQEERIPVSVAATLSAAPASHNAGSSANVPLWHSVPGAGWDTFDSLERSFADVVSSDPFEVSRMLTSS